MKLYLLRHGKTMANRTYTYCGVTDMLLTGEGIEQLKAKKEAGGYPDPEGLDIFTSGLSRTEQTLRILFGNVPHSANSAFAEMDFGVFEGFSYDQLKDREDYQAWISGDHMANRCPGGESGNEMKERVLKGLEPIIKSGRDTMIVCHGGVIAILFEHFFPDSGLGWYERQPSNGEGYLFVFEDGRALSWERIPRKI
ncbi:MAG: histidine phosphatase family protein [Firmicutes bacterium]|nr:histidine phosphatase family protein [Bacillota bacterium]